MKPRSNAEISSRVASFILSQDTEELAVLTGEKVAQSLGLDTSIMTRIFEAVQHISLEGFIIREKIYRAFFLLEQNHDVSIEELAKKMGFSQPVEFTREFQHYLLIDPASFKKIKTLKSKS